MHIISAVWVIMVSGVLHARLSRLSGGLSASAGRGRGVLSGYCMITECYALIQPQWLTGRKTPSYLLTYLRA